LILIQTVARTLGGSRVIMPVPLTLVI